MPKYITYDKPFLLDIKPRRAQNQRDPLRGNLIIEQESHRFDEKNIKAPDVSKYQKVFGQLNQINYAVDWNGGISVHRI